MKKVGKQSFEVANTYVYESGVVVGPKEGEGPLSYFFDKIVNDLYYGEKSWEKAEMKMFSEAIDICLQKNNISEEEVDAMVCGDLNNQIIIGNYVLRNYSFPHIGVFSACSTSVLSMIIASQFIESGTLKKVLAGTSSHNSTAERQFRYPTEYGGQKVDSLTSTATASGVILLGNEKSDIKLTRATIGRVYDNEINDASDMGRVMSIAAFYTIKQHFEDFGISPDDYDLIVTGDLSFYGKDMLIKIFDEYDINMHKNYDDCGVMIYDREHQNVFAGGSGCGCCAAVSFGYLLKALRDGRYNKILIVATGALMNPIILAQKETIPSIAHAICLERIN